jgi:hypothetical protein
MELSDYREQALRFRALADGAHEGELRAELRQLSAAMARWIVATEIRAMTGESPTDKKGGRGLLARWRRRGWLWPRGGVTDRAAAVKASPL